MEYLFERKDRDGDRVAIWTNDNPDAGPNMVITTAAYDWSLGEGVQVALYPQDVNRLHSALGAWLAEHNVTAQTTPLVPPIRIKEWIQEEITRVLPLHLANLSDAGENWQVCGEDPVPVPVLPGGPIIPLQGYCTCGHTKWAHNNDGLPQCQVAECTCKLTRAQVRGFETVPVSAPRLMSEVRKRGTAPGCTCTHTADKHDPENGCTYKATWMHSECGCQWTGMS